MNSKWNCIYSLEEKDCFPWFPSEPPFGLNSKGLEKSAAAQTPPRGLWRRRQPEAWWLSESSRATSHRAARRGPTPFAPCAAGTMKSLPTRCCLTKAQREKNWSIHTKAGPHFFL